MNASQRTRLLFLILLLEAAVAVTLASSAFMARTLGQRPVFQKPLGASFKLLGKFSFESQETLKKWEEKVFKGKTLYRVLTENEQGYLKSSSQNASSGLYVKINYEVAPNLFLSWRWRAIIFPQKKNPEKLANRGEDDFAARLYVIFPGSTFFNSNVIEYIWDEKLPVGATASSPFSDRVKLFVIRSGKPTEGEEGVWQVEERNIFQDYVQLYGKEPKRPVGAVALMSDSDNTATRSESDFGDIAFKLKEMKR
ncbi:MAG: DUF3047 domain-containing protein [Candidatus Omnitrophota bacterium]